MQTLPVSLFCSESRDGSETSHQTIRIRIQHLVWFSLPRVLRSSRVTASHVHVVASHRRTSTSDVPLGKLRMGSLPLRFLPRFRRGRGCRSGSIRNIHVSTRTRSVHRRVPTRPCDWRTSRRRTVPAFVRIEGTRSVELLVSRMRLLPGFLLERRRRNVRNTNDEFVQAARDVLSAG